MIGSKEDIKLSSLEKEEVVKALLTALRLSPPGGKWQFLWNPDNPFSFAGGFGFEFYIDFEKQNIASVGLIKSYPDIFNGYPIAIASSILKRYFESIISDIGTDRLFFAKDRNKTVLDLTTPEIIPSLSSKLEKFINENVKPSIYLMPLKAFPCPKKLVTESICWVPGNFDLNEILNPYGIKPSLINNCFFPPINHPKMKLHPLSLSDSWLICQASSENESESTFKRMIGALSVILKYPNSRLITSRRMIRGRAKFSKKGSFTLFDKPCLAPAVGGPVEIDINMVDKFQELLVNKANNNRLQIALEYLSDAWGNTTKLSFINASIAMDALFGVDGKVKTSILSGVEKYAVSIPKVKEKYNLILRIRNNLLHGEFSSIETCPEYVSYFERFKCDPIDDQFIILHTCILNL